MIRRFGTASLTRRISAMSRVVGLAESSERSAEASGSTCHVRKQAEGDSSGDNVAEVHEKLLYADGPARHTEISATAQVAGTAATRGIRTTNVAPFPSSLVTSISAACAFAMLSAI